MRLKLDGDSDTSLVKTTVELIRDANNPLQTEISKLTEIGIELEIIFH